MILECCNAASFLLVEIKFKISLYKELLNAVLLPAALFYHSGHSKLDHLEARGNHLANISGRNAAFRRTMNCQPSVISKGYFPNDNLEKFTIEMQQLTSEKKKKKIGNSIIVVLIKKTNKQKKASPG